MEIKKLSDLKDGSIVITLGNILFDDVKDSCEYIYIKLGKRLLGYHNWFPIDSYNDISKDFSMKDNRKIFATFEYEIKEIYDYDEELFYNLNFLAIQDKLKTKTPIWGKSVFNITNAEIDEYFYDNYDISINIIDVD